MTDVMVDIETLGTTSDSSILSIGAVAFDSSGVTNEFYARVDLDSCLRHGLRIDANTIAWWMDQSDAARAVFHEIGRELPEALATFSNSFEWENTKIWCNGLNFDLPILDTAYRACGMKAPWAYYNARDYRTVMRELPDELRKQLCITPKVKHNALEDARAQAQSLIALRAWQHGNCPAHALQAVG